MSIDLGDSALWICIAAIFIASRYFRYKRGQEYYQTVRMFVEKGQPVPPDLVNPFFRKDGPNPFDQFNSSAARKDPSVKCNSDFRFSFRWRKRHDWRSGLIFISVGVGVFLWQYLQVEPDFSPSIAAIPICIGLALLLSAALTGNNDGSPPADSTDPTNKL